MGRTKRRSVYLTHNDELEFLQLSLIHHSWKVNELAHL